MLPDLPSHSSLMSIRMANVQLPAEVLCLSLRSAQGSKCSGSHVCPSVSCVSPRVLKVLLHLGGWGWEEGVPSKADHVEFKFRPTCRGCGPELPWIHVGAHTQALGQRLGVMGSGKASLDGAEDETGLNRCWTVSVWPHMPALNRRVPPTFHSDLPPQNVSASSRPAQTAQIEGQQ